MIELAIVMSLNKSKVLERCVKFGYKGTTDEELMSFYMDILISQHIVGYMQNEIELDAFGSPDIAWSAGAPETPK